ncbi:hypothetical protein [Clostridium baratii]|uniref:hypothetical protein n=1 Tax=Clostridium baratii TaxID=1561 RepID=UPI002942A133|nr:hypothetical protein [Clostridium baratii]
MLRNKKLIKENQRLKEELEFKNKYIKDLEEQSKKYWKWFDKASREILEMQNKELQKQVQELKEMNKKVEEI